MTYALPPFSDNDSTKDSWPVFEKGWVWLVGGGPGDAGLLTLHALNALNQADIVVYDALVDKQILKWARAGSRVEYAGKRGGKPSHHQKDISMRLIELAKAGERVLRLKGGDPFVFGRGGEEAQSLVSAGIPIRIVPGISAGIGGLAYAGIPVTHRDVNQAVTFISGHDRFGLTPSAINWEGLAQSSPVIVMYMGLKHIGEISARLIAAGRDQDEPVAVVANATLPTMKVLETTLAKVEADIASYGIEPPTIICIGKVVLMRQCLDWIGQMTGEAIRDLDPLKVRNNLE